MKTYLVGGAVRDQLLDWPVEERDWLVVGSSAEEMIAAGFLPVGREFPVFLHPETKEEYALARTERKTSRGYRGFEIFASPEVTLEEDLLRRDLTINALAQDHDGTLIDPYGGLRDLEQRVLRHVSPAFSEDPVRILRVARFAARYDQLGFVIAPETMHFMRRMVEEGEVDHLVPERIWQEFEKALKEPKPRRFVEVLRECGALARLFPEIERLFGVPQPEKYHGKMDAGEHTLMVLDVMSQFSSDPLPRFAALLHDLGKGLTPASLLPRHHGHDQRGVKAIRELCSRIKCPHAYVDLAIMTSRFHMAIHRAEEQRPKTLLNILKRCDAFRRPDRFELLLQVCKADHIGRGEGAFRHYPQASFFRECLSALNQISIADLVEEGVSGVEIKERLELRRLELLGKIRDRYRKESGERGGSRL
jgi:tRNA nucleotidyltransferase (CCA-adding enzyme)